MIFSSIPSIPSIPRPLHRSPALVLSRPAVRSARQVRVRPCPSVYSRPPSAAPHGRPAVRVLRLLRFLRISSRNPRTNSPNSTDVIAPFTFSEKFFEKRLDIS